MPAKRIRCVCGKIYDPVVQAQCPACGTQARVGNLPAVNIAGATAPPPPPSPVQAPLPPAFASTSSLPPPPPPPPLAVPTGGNVSVIRGRRAAAIAAAAVVAFLLVLAAALLFRPWQQHREVAPANLDERKDFPSPSPAPTTTAPRARNPWIADAQSAADSDGRDLAAILAKAGDGDTVRIRPGTYTGGLVLSKAVRLIGEGNPSSQGAGVVLQANGAECVSVRAKGVVLENLQLTADAPTTAAIVAIADGAELEIKNCAVNSAAGPGCVASGTSALIASDCTFKTPAGVALELAGGARAQCTGCRFNDCQIACKVSDAAGADLRTCAFENNGRPDGTGGIATASGEGAKLTVADCKLKGNPGGIRVSGSALAEISDCTFADNGISAGSSFGEGLVSVGRGGRAIFAGNTCEANLQGLAVRDGGTLEVERCRLASCGLATAPGSGPSPPCLPLSATGAGSSLTVRRTSVVEAKVPALHVLSGATLVLEDSELSGSPIAGLLVGEPGGPPAQATVKRTVFARNTIGCRVRAASHAEIEGGEFSDNGTGAVAQESGTRLGLRAVSLNRNRDYGIHAQSGADATADDCVLEGNERGAWSGVEKNSAGRASFTLTNCRVNGSRAFAAGACVQSFLALNNCSIAPNPSAIYRERGATVRTATSSAAATTGGEAGLSPADEASVAPGADDGTERASASRRPRGERRRASSSSSRSTGENIARTIRRFFR